MKIRTNSKFRPPKHLSKEAKRLFRFLRDEYSQDGDEDNVVWKLRLDTAGEAYDRYQNIRKTIDKEGLCAPGKQRSTQPTLLKMDEKAGRLRPHPLLAAEAAARASFLNCLRSLGIDYEPLKEIGRPKGS